jgi:hypothetical protein
VYVKAKEVGEKQTQRLGNMVPPLKRRPARLSFHPCSLQAIRQKEIKDEVKDKRLENRSIDALHSCIFSRTNNTEDKSERECRIYTMKLILIAYLLFHCVFPLFVSTSRWLVKT